MTASPELRPAHIPPLEEHLAAAVGANDKPSAMARLCEIHNGNARRIPREYDFTMGETGPVMFGN